MAGGLVKYRHLSRNSAARQALLRGLVTQLVHHEHIQTTHAKAKEAQRLAEKLVTLAKRGNETSRRSVQGILYEPQQYMPKVFGELRDRYSTRAGGYTRVTRTEPRNKADQAETSILEFVDGPKDTKFMMTAKTVARDRLLGRTTTPVTKVNIKKVTQFRGEQSFEDMVQRFMEMSTEEPVSAEQERMNSRLHWEPKLAKFKQPQMLSKVKSESFPSTAALEGEGPSHAEAEASKMAEMEAKKTEHIGPKVVSGSQKQG